MKTKGDNVNHSFLNLIAAIIFFFNTLVFCTLPVNALPAQDFISIYTVVFHPGQNLQGGSSYSWDFNNDGTADSTEVDGSYVFPGPGAYSVKLTKTNSDGSTNSVLKTITISEVLGNGVPPPPPAPVLPSNWLDGAWKGRTKITIAPGKVEADLVDFPVYVNLADLGSSSNAWTKMKADCSDIRITKADGKTELPREIVSCDVAGKAGELHFKAAGTLSSSTINEFYIYYGNSAAVDYAADAALGRENVWTANYKAVWHMNQSPSASTKIIDSTSSHADLQPMGSMSNTNLVQGYIGKAIKFNGVSNTYLYSNNTNLNLNTNLTTSVFVKLDEANAPRAIIDWGEGSLAKRRCLLMRPSGKLLFSINSYSESDSDFVLSNNWTSVTGSLSNSSVSKLYINGLFSQGSYPSPGAAAFSFTNGFKLGANLGGAEPWLGIIDEARISNIERQPYWIKAEYANLYSSLSFYILSAQEDI